MTTMKGSNNATSTSSTRLSCRSLSGCYSTFFLPHFPTEMTPPLPPRFFPSRGVSIVLLLLLPYAPSNDAFLMVSPCVRVPAAPATGLRTASPMLSRIGSESALRSSHGNEEEGGAPAGRTSEGPLSDDTDTASTQAASLPPSATTTVMPSSSSSPPSSAPVAAKATKATASNVLCPNCDLCDGSGRYVRVLQPLNSN